MTRWGNILNDYNADEKRKLLEIIIEVMFEEMNEETRQKLLAFGERSQCHTRNVRQLWTSSGSNAHDQTQDHA